VPWGHFLERHVEAVVAVGEAEAALAAGLGGEEDRPQDAYHREELAGEGQGLAHDVRVGSELPLSR
jgi:hypothetical protein